MVDTGRQVCDTAPMTNEQNTIDPADPSARYCEHCGGYHHEDDMDGAFGFCFTCTDKIKKEEGIE